MPPNPVQPDDGAWEKELGPRVSKQYFIATIVCFIAWMCFLAYHAARRWFGDMQ